MFEVREDGRFWERSCAGGMCWCCCSCLVALAALFFILFSFSVLFCPDQKGLLRDSVPCFAKQVQNIVST